jgi:glycosyltransferase involved in cell wall biosynthesis
MPDDAPTATPTPKRQRLIYLGHYPLHQLASAPEVRIHSLHQALAPLCDLTFLTGSREQRRKPLWQMIRSGAWRDFDGVYVEAASSTAMEADLVLLKLWHDAGIPVSLFVRDAYPMFPDYFDSRPFKHKLLKAAWYVSMAAYRRWCSILYFPTRMLADVIPFADKRLLPPGGDLRPQPDPRTRRGVIYVGSAQAVAGAQNLLKAMDLVVAKHPDATLRFVTPNPAPLGEWRDRPWLTVESISGETLTERLLAAAVAVIPRPRGAYNDLCLPVKLLDYLSHGLPIVSTDCPEAADFLTAVGAGEIVADSPEGLAAGIERLLTDADLRLQRSEAAAAAVGSAHSWSRRAETIVADLFGAVVGQQTAEIQPPPSGAGG